jgi:hypothetical protein
MERQGTHSLKVAIASQLAKLEFLEVLASKIRKSIVLERTRADPKIRPNELPKPTPNYKSPLPPG